MKITAIHAHPLRAKLDTTYWLGNHSFSEASLIVVKVDTDQGLSGLATLHGGSQKAACAMLDALNDVVVGMDPLAHEDVWETVFGVSTAVPDPTKPQVSKVLTAKDQRAGLMRALAGIDIALWDIKGKSVGLPIWRLLGGKQNTVPAYVTGGYYQENRDNSGFDGELAGYVDAGYSAVKIKIGGLPIEEEAARIGAARRELGPTCKLMLDGNGAYALPDAERAIATFEEHGIAWFEEPLHWYDSVRALGKLANRTHVPIASGESELHAWACRDLVDLGGVRIMQFDATRSGGVTEWLRVAAYCHLHGVVMSTHHEPHIQCHLSAAVPNGGIAETFPNAARDPYWDTLYTERADIRNGMVILNDKPGFGFDIDWDTVKRYAA